MSLRARRKYADGRARCGAMQGFSPRMEWLTETLQCGAIGQRSTHCFRAIFPVTTAAHYSAMAKRPAINGTLFVSFRARRKYADGHARCGAIRSFVAHRMARGSAATRALAVHPVATAIQYSAMVKAPRDKRDAFPIICVTSRRAPRRPPRSPALWRSRRESAHARTARAAFSAAARASPPARPRAPQSACPRRAR